MNIKIVEIVYLMLISMENQRDAKSTKMIENHNMKYVYVEKVVRPLIMKMKKEQNIVMTVN